MPSPEPEPSLPDVEPEPDNPVSEPTPGPEPPGVDVLPVPEPTLEPATPLDPRSVLVPEPLGTEPLVTPDDPAPDDPVPDEPTPLPACNPLSPNELLDDSRQQPSAYTGSPFSGDMPTNRIR